MNHKLALIGFILLVTVTAISQHRPRPVPQAATEPVAARLMVQGTYEDNYQGITSNGNAQGKLLIKFEAARWLSVSTNEVGNPEFSDLEAAPVPHVTGSVTYEGRVKGSGGGDSYEATSNFAGPLAGEDIVLSTPEYTESGNGLKLRVLIKPRLKGKCSLVSVRNGETSTSDDCQNGTYFFTPSSPVHIDDNDDPAKTKEGAYIADFGIELDVEPEVSAGPAQTMGQGPAGDAGVYAWRGAVTNGSPEAGFKILLNKTRELPGDDKRSKSIRILNFTATIVPGIPKQGS